jgi:hypothetical protein
MVWLTLPESCDGEAVRYTRESVVRFEGPGRPRLQLAQNTSI